MTNIQSAKQSTLAIVIAALICSAGCSVPSPAPGETPLLVITPSSTAVPSPDPELPTQTPPAPSPTLAPTPRPALTAEEKYAYVQEMLTSNAGCELPCWWGITPGESGWQEARSQLPYLNFQFRFSENLGDYDVHLDLAEEDGLVQSIEIVSYCLQDERDRFTQDWSHYSLDQVLNRYGVPSRARIIWGLPVERGAPAYYLLYVFYDDLGIRIIYNSPAVWQGEALRTCFSFDYIALWLQSPGALTSLEQSIDPVTWSYTVPLDEATGMSLEEFYETFRHPGACLEAPPTF